MKLNKLVALVLALAMVLSMAACTETPADPSGSSTPGTSTPAPTDPKPTDPAKPEPVVTDGEVSIDFEDGNFGFVALYEGRANSDASTMEVVEKYGNKALKVTNGSGKVPYVAIDVLSLLGDNAANVKTIEMTLGIENPDGKFYACSGNLMLWTADKLSSTTYGWSVYLENKNPKTATFALKDYEAFSAENPVAVLTLDTDNGATAGAANASLYIFNISFKDASGNLLTADSSATFTAPNGFSADKDMSNLQKLKGAVALDGFACSAAEWNQAGLELTDEQIALLVPGAVIEIEFSSATGDMWIVMPDAAAGWTRIEQQTAATNNSKNICQITYEQIAAVLGDDVSQWFANGKRIQCESSGAWEVFSVKIGKASGLVNSASKTTWHEGSISAAEWNQAGIELTDEQIAALVPGTMIEVTYTTVSPTGDMWIVMPDAAAGWTRIEQQTAACDGATMQITFEQIAAVLGDDVSQWFANGKRLQLESDGAWEVYSISLVTSCFQNVSNPVGLEGFACSAAEWNQAGLELTDEQIALLVPGSVIEIKYTSVTGDMWIVMPDAAAGWTRIEQQTAACDGETCQITFEQIAAVLGDDVSQWFANGKRIQCESSGAWEVFAVSIGTGSAAATEPDEGGDEPTVEIPVPEIPAVPEGATELYSGTAALSGWQMVTQVNTTVWGGTVDPAAFTEGGTFSVYFTGKDVFSVHLCFNGGVSATWVQLDCELANTTDLGDGTYVATFSMDDMIAQYGSDMSGLGAVMVYSNSDAAGYAIVTLVTYTPAA